MSHPFSVDRPASHRSTCGGCPRGASGANCCQKSLVWSLTRLSMGDRDGDSQPDLLTFVDAVDQAKREPHPSYGRRATRRAWLAFCVTSTAVTQNASQARSWWTGRGSDSARESSVNSVDKGAYKGGRLSNDHSGLHGQSGERQYPRDCIDSLHLTSTERTSYNRMMVAGRAVYRGRMVQARYLELDRSTQLPPTP